MNPGVASRAERRPCDISAEIVVNNGGERASFMQWRASKVDG